ncbi:uncharacterized protein TNCV_2581311 [Trichonephila clavipes]|nr:uncharacterized protein TNCV_2581311 [Trichonephila clavipes]
MYKNKNADTRGKWLEFSNHKFKLPVPYVIYADLECILEKINSCEQDPKISSTESIAKHVPCGFAYVIVGPDGTMVKPPTVFRGKNAIDQFLTKLLDEEKSILDILRFVKPMVFSMTDEENFKSSTLCSICGNPINGDALYHPSFMEHSKKFVLLPEERLQNFVSEQLSELDEKMQSILRNKNMNDSEKVTLYLQILQKYVNFPFPKEINEDMQEPQMEFKNSNAEDLKSVILNEDSKEALGFIKQETSAENIEQEIEKSAPKKYKAIIKKIILFIQKHREEIYWTPDKELIVDGKIIRNTNVVHLITHLVRDRKIKPFGFESFDEFLKRKKFPSNFVKNKYLKTKTLYAKPLSWIDY